MTEAEEAARSALLKGDSAAELELYAEILGDKGIEWGLLGPREADRIWHRHISNSLALQDLIPHGGRIVDIGSGAGLPGIPLAIVRPDLDVTLLEPLLRRSSFLTETVASLGLADRVRVVRGRAEDVELNFDMATCRAVAPLTKLLGWTKSLFVHSGVLLALKGERAEAELVDAAGLLAKGGLEGSVLELGTGLGATRAIRVRASR